MNLSENFTLEEMIASETAARHNIDQTPSNDVLLNLRRLALFLEDVRKVLDKPIQISSAYRSPLANEAVGGKKTSQHCRGTAADIKVKGMTPNQVVQAIIKSGLPYDQVIREFSDPVKGGGWTHVSIPNGKDIAPRKQALIVDSKGTRQFN